MISADAVVVQIMTDSIKLCRQRHKSRGQQSASFAGRRPDQPSAMAGLENANFAINSRECAA